jgi:multidrug transporter EmrE-like cation transporter
VYGSNLPRIEAGFSLTNFGAWREYALAIIAYSLGFVAYAAALRSVRLDVAYPLMVGFATLFVYLWTALWGGESISLRGILGAVLIVCGIFMISTPFNS